MIRESLVYRIAMARQIHHGRVEFFIDYAKPGTAYEQLENELHRIVDAEIARRLGCRADNHNQMEEVR